MSRLLVKTFIKKDLCRWPLKISQICCVLPLLQVVLGARLLSHSSFTAHVLAHTTVAQRRCSWQAAAWFQVQHPTQSQCYHCTVAIIYQPSQRFSFKKGNEVCDRPMSHLKHCLYPCILVLWPLSCALALPSLLRPELSLTHPRWHSAGTRPWGCSDRTGMI